MCNVRRATSPLPEKEHQTLYGDHRRRTDVTCNLLVYLPPPLFYKSSLFPIPLSLSLWGLCVICSENHDPVSLCAAKQDPHFECNTNSPRPRRNIAEIRIKPHKSATLVYPLLKNLHTLFGGGAYYTSALSMFKARTNNCFDTL